MIEIERRSEVLWHDETDKPASEWASDKKAPNDMNQCRLATPASHGKAIAQHVFQHWILNEEHTTKRTHYIFIAYCIRNRIGNFECLCLFIGDDAPVNFITPFTLNFLLELRSIWLTKKSSLFLLQQMRYDAVLC